MIAKKVNSTIHKKQLQIPHQSRKELIRLVTCENKSVKSAHSRVGINYSTAKMIVRKYKKNGKITKFRREKLKKQQQNNPEEHALSQEYIGQNIIEQNLKTVPKEGQQINSFQFPNIYVPDQQFYSQMDFSNFAIQLCQMQPMFWWNPAQIYFPF